MMPGASILGADPLGSLPQDTVRFLGADHGLSLAVAEIVIPIKNVDAGVLVKSTAIIWSEIALRLGGDWTLASELTPRKWEEMVAGAFDKAGYDEVVLTPRSGDHGRDVIAHKHGVGCVKIIGSVKAYAPGNLVNYDDVRSLIGVMTGERDTSKAIITTTSDFSPNMNKDPFIAPFLPTRLELVNGRALQRWLSDLAAN